MVAGREVGAGAVAESSRLESRPRGRGRQTGLEMSQIFLNLKAHPQ